MFAPLRWACALALAFAAGVGMSFGQTYGPDAIAPLFNSAAPVVAISAIAAVAARRSWTSALIGALAAPALVAGYYVTSHVRGYSGSGGWITVWSTAGVLFGAVMGLAVWILRSSRSQVLRGLASAVWPGIALGEAWHGLTRIADSTPASYWYTQAAIGAAVFVWLAVTRVKTWPTRALGLVATVATAAIIYTVYGVG